MSFSSQMSDRGAAVLAADTLFSMDAKQFTESFPTRRASSMLPVWSLEFVLAGGKDERLLRAKSLFLRSGPYSSPELLRWNCKIALNSVFPHG